MIKTTPVDESLISRPALAQRWEQHPETIKRKERQGILHPIRLSPRAIRYKMSEIVALEAAGMGPQTNTRIPGAFVSSSTSIPASTSSTPAPAPAAKRQHGRPMKRSPKARGVHVVLQDEVS